MINRIRLRKRIFKLRKINRLLLRKKKMGKRIYDRKNLERIEEIL